VVVATTAKHAAEVIGSRRAPALAAALGSVRYNPIATVVAQYASFKFPKGASGLFLPRGCATAHVAKYDEDNRVRFTFSGVAARQALADGDLAALLDLGEAHFRQFGGNLGRRLSHTGRLWSPGLCNQSRMHHRIIGAIQTNMDSVGGLALCGDYLRGNALETCVVAARESVDRVLAQESRAVNGQARAALEGGAL